MALITTDFTWYDRFGAPHDIKTMTTSHLMFACELCRRVIAKHSDRRDAVIMVGKNRARTALDRMAKELHRRLHEVNPTFRECMR